MKNKILIICLMLLCSYYVVCPVGRDGMLPQASQVSYPTDRAAARAALQGELVSYGYGAKIEGIYDLTDNEDVCKMCGRGALWNRTYISHPSYVFMANTNPSNVYDKDGNMLRFENPITPISNPFVFNSLEDIRDLAAKLQNGGALPNAYLMLFPLSFKGTNEIWNIGGSQVISLLYFDPRGFFFSINQSNSIFAGSVLHSYWTMNQAFYDEVTLRQIVASKIPAILPPSSINIPDEVMNELLARGAILGYRKSDTAALEKLGALNPQGRSTDGQIVQYGSSAQLIQEAIVALTDQAIANQSSIPHAVLTVDGKTLYLCMHPKGNGDYYLYLTPNQPEDKIFKWDRVSIVQNPAWANDTDRNAAADHKFAVWCANGITDSEWTVEPKYHLEFLKDFLFKGKFSSSSVTADFIKGVSFIQKHIDGNNPELIKEFTKYVKEVSKHLSPTQYVPVITQAAIDLLVSVITARPAAYEAKAPDFRDKLAATAFSTLYLGLTIPTFPREAIDYFYTCAEIINSMKNSAEESDTDYYTKLQDATAACVLSLQQWIARDLVKPAELPLALEDVSAKQLIEELQENFEKKLEASGRRHEEMIQTLLSQNQELLAALNRRSRSGSSASGVSSRRSHRSEFTPAARAQNVASEAAASSLPRTPGSATVRASSEHAPSERSSASTWHMVPPLE